VLCLSAEIVAFAGTSFLIGNRTAPAGQSQAAQKPVAFDAVFKGRSVWRANADHWHCGPVIATGCDLAALRARTVRYLAAGR
jgi:hypothetical protein